MNRIKKIANNEYIFSIATKFVNMGCSVLQSILVARYLGAELKGHNALITSIVSIGAIIITFGMHQAYPYVRKKYGKEQIYNNYLSVLSYVFILYFLLAVVVSLFVPKIDIRVAILLIPIAGYAKALGYVSLIELPNRYNTLHLIIVGIDLLCVYIHKEQLFLGYCYCVAFICSGACGLLQQIEVPVCLEERTVFPCQRALFIWILSHAGTADDHTELQSRCLNAKRFSGNYHNGANWHLFCWYVDH